MDGWARGCFGLWSSLRKIKKRVIELSFTSPEYYSWFLFFLISLHGENFVNSLIHTTWPLTRIQVRWLNFFEDLLTEESWCARLWKVRRHGRSCEIHMSICFCSCWTKVVPTHGRTPQWATKQHDGETLWVLYFRNVAHGTDCTELLMRKSHCFSHCVI